MSWLIKRAKAAVADEDRDILWIIDSQGDNLYGSVGSGKSDFALQLAHAFDPDFDVEAQTVVANDYRKLMKLYAEGRRGMVILYDEAQEAVDKQRWQDSGVKWLREEFRRNRKRGFVHLMTAPSMWHFVPYLTLDRVQRRFVVINRGHMKVFRRRCPCKRHIDVDKNLWGSLETEVVGIPDVSTAIHPLVWDQYEGLMDSVAARQTAGLHAELAAQDRKQANARGRA